MLQTCKFIKSCIIKKSATKIEKNLPQIQKCCSCDQHAVHIAHWHVVVCTTAYETTNITNCCILFTAHRKSNERIRIQLRACWARVCRLFEQWTWTFKFWKPCWIRNASTVLRIFLRIFTSSWISTKHRWSFCFSNFRNESDFKSSQHADNIRRIFNRSSPFSGFWIRRISRIFIGLWSHAPLLRRTHEPVPSMSNLGRFTSR